MRMYLSNIWVMPSIHKRMEKRAQGDECAWLHESYNKLKRDQKIFLLLFDAQRKKARTFCNNKSN